VALAIGAASAWSGLEQSAGSGHARRNDCVLVQSLDDPAPYVSDPAECSVRTAPASTFKLPHALIALETGVVPNARQIVKWEGTRQPFPVWEQDHSLDSAVKWSVVWFFRRTAASIGGDRMREYLSRFGYAEDMFEGDVTSFWLNGDLVVSPGEQLRFLRRMVRDDLPVARRHIDAVSAAYLMPPGVITNASGTHPFVLDWPRPLVVRAKSGNTAVGEERVSWLVGHIETGGRQYVFVSRVRADEALPGTAGLDLALRMLNSWRPAPGR
jgi:beta-lactamase class D